ncbi:MAG: hypothetical protein PHU51_05085 [Candidatus Nanoarchaeia archaeon]|nr:hypothetical protein [Candidatus Nanoarchaeia archaeon]
MTIVQNKQAAREKLFDEHEIKEDYLQKLNGVDAKTYLSLAETKSFEKELEKRSKKIN